MFNWWEIFLLTFILLQDFSQSLRLVEVRIPNYVIRGSTAQLECLYDLDGEVLYSVKWYKDGNEFYRYLPRDMPPAQTFLLPGVSVDIHNSTDAVVSLREVTLQSSGRFRCEVSGEAPSFQTVTEHGDMVVVSLPDQGPPRISGGRPRYQIGDWVRINCTAGRSKPAVQLSWFVNGESVDPHTLRKYDTIISGREGLETSVLGLQFRVEQHHFRNGDMKLKCVASLSTFYWRSNEESVEGDRPQKAPVLESRETVYASNSRADPVQGTSMRESFVTKILSFFLQPNAASKTDSSVFIKPCTLVLLIAMTLLTTSGCLQHFYLNNLLQIVKKQSINPYSNNIKSIDEDECCEYKKDKNLEQPEPDKFKRILCNKFQFQGNKKMSSLAVTLRAAKINKELVGTQVTLISVVQEANTTLQTFVSCKTATTKSSSATILSASPSSFSCCPSLTAAQQKVVTVASR